MEFVRHNRKAFMIMAAALSAIALAGFVTTTSLQSEQLVSYHPNDRANHHPLHPNN